MLFNTVSMIPASMPTPSSASVIFCRAFSALFRAPFRVWLSPMGWGGVSLETFTPQIFTFPSSFCITFFTAEILTGFSDPTAIIFIEITFKFRAVDNGNKF